MRPKQRRPIPKIRALHLKKVKAIENLQPTQASLPPCTHGRSCLEMRSELPVCAAQQLSNMVRTNFKPKDKGTHSRTQLKTLKAKAGGRCSRTSEHSQGTLKASPYPLPFLKAASCPLPFPAKSRAGCRRGEVSRFFGH